MILEATRAAEPDPDGAANQSDRNRDMNDETRLDRIEGKLDRLADAVVALARLEERTATLFRQMEKYDSQILRLTERIGEIERINIGRSLLFRVLDKVFWLMVGGAVAVSLKYFGGA